MKAEEQSVEQGPVRQAVERFKARKARHKERRAWSEAKKRRVLAYYDKHGSTATQAKFSIYNSMLYRWRNERGQAKPKKKYRVAVRVAKARVPRAPASNVRDAIIYLEHAEREMRATFKTVELTDAELFALLALRTLKKGGE